MCRKLCRGFLAALLAFSICSTGALAATPKNFGLLEHCNVYGKTVCVDRNGDGICDSHGESCWYGHHSVRQHHLCRRPGGYLCHYTAGGSWVRCADADCNGFCDTCGRALPVTAGTVGNGGNTSGNAGTVGNGGSSTGNSGSSTGNGSYGNYGSGYYGGGYCGSSGHHSYGHHSGHHGGHC